MFIWTKLSTILKFYISALILAALVIIGLAAFYIFKKENIEQNYDDIIISSAKRYNVNPNLIKAVIWKESSFKSLIIGSKKERGLMQIMEKHAVQDWVNYRNCEMPPPGILYSPEVNIDIGTWYLARCQAHWANSRDSMALTIAEYNAGYKNAKEWASKENDNSVIDRITFPSTKKYVISILNQFQKYQNSQSQLRD